MDLTASYLQRAILSLLVCALAGCGTNPSAVPSTLQPSNLRKPGIPLQLSDASGKDVRLSDYRGKVVLLNFWATECGGCRTEIPWLTDFDRNLGRQGLIVLGVAMDVQYEGLKSSSDAWNRINRFDRAYEIQYPVLLGDEKVMKKYDIQQFPLTFLIDRQGRFAARYSGILDRQGAEKNIQALLLEN